MKGNLIKNARFFKLIKKRRIINAKKMKTYFFNVFIIFVIFSFLFLLDVILNKKSSIKKYYITTFANLNNKFTKTKVCVCSPVKEENRREFIQHYKKYGVDKMFLYDNNDIEGEKFDDILKDYITKGFVEILNRRGKKDGMHEIMNNCYKNNYEK